MIRIRRLLTTLTIVFVVLPLWTSMVYSEPYRLGVGDQITILHNGAVDPLNLSVDTDGQIRLATIGGVSVVGLTLDNAESEIAHQLEDQGFYVDPIVSLTVREYAPVIVGGDVTRPGQFTYLPGMTVAAALALSGGQQSSGLSQTEVARARAEAQAALLTANLDIALAVARLARFQAELGGLDRAITLSTEQNRRVPSPELADVTAILRKEADVLASERARARKLVAFWEDEIATIKRQAGNFDARIAVQQEIVASTLANLETAQELSERGLQTAARLSVAEQRAADARARVLELEAAKMAAARAISTAQRERVVFLANQEREALIGVQEMTHDVEAATYRYHRAEEQLAALAGISAGGAADSDAVKLVFELQTTRGSRPSGTEITGKTLLLPGEVLIVSIVPLVTDLDG